jgi:hypothetical protein
MPNDKLFQYMSEIKDIISNLEDNIMSRKEEDAKKLICPLIAIAGQLSHLSYDGQHHHDPRLTDIDNDGAIRCRGSECMFWNKDELDPTMGNCGLILKDSSKDT